MNEQIYVTYTGVLTCHAGDKAYFHQSADPYPVSVTCDDMALGAAAQSINYITDVCIPQMKSD
jgi:hypothetical protein